MIESNAPAWVSECIRRGKVKRMGEPQLRCKDCKWCGVSGLVWRCWRPGAYPKRVNPGQFACRRFVYKDK